MYSALKNNRTTLSYWEDVFLGIRFHLSRAGPRLLSLTSGSRVDLPLYPAPPPSSRRRQNRGEAGVRRRRPPTTPAVPGGAGTTDGTGREHRIRLGAEPTPGRGGTRAHHGGRGRRRPDLGKTRPQRLRRQGEEVRRFAGVRGLLWWWWNEGRGSASGEFSRAWLVAMAADHGRERPWGSGKRVGRGSRGCWSRS